MNSFLLIFVALILFWWGYKFYAEKICSLFNIDEHRPTPAHTKFDGIDYVPVKHWLVLFGHHFSSIAGAGPIIGPIVAVVAWGWLGAVVWIIGGTILIGGIHDLGALAVSVRKNGESIGQIAEEVISKRARLLFSIFLWLALILVVAVFVYVCAETFVVEPKIVIPSLGLIPVAVLIGFMLYNLKTNLVGTTILSLVLLTGLIFLGLYFPVKSSITFWMLVLLVYSYIASVTPVNILLQPRDYISSYLLFFSVIVGVVSVALTRPNIQSPAFLGWFTSSGQLWPMMCVTVACGAVSGFHSLIASGTTSKQLANEKNIKTIAYGGMVLEAVVALIAVIAITTGIAQNDLAGLLKSLGPVGLFGKGYGSLTKVLLGGFGGFVAITTLNAFVLTTLDTATRITRYITEELFGFKNRFVSTSIVVFLAGWLALSGQWNKIWPAFGASNQLVAALALLVVSSYLLMHKKRVRYTLIPAVFMTFTTILALIYQSITYFRNGDYLLFSIAVILMVLAGFMILEIKNKLF